MAKEGGEAAKMFHAEGEASAKANPALVCFWKSKCSKALGFLYLAIAKGRLYQMGVLYTFDFGLESWFKIFHGNTHQNQFLVSLFLSLSHPSRKQGYSCLE